MTVFNSVRREFVITYIDLSIVVAVLVSHLIDVTQSPKTQKRLHNAQVSLQIIDTILVT